MSLEWRQCNHSITRSFSKHVHSADVNVFASQPGQFRPLYETCLNEKPKVPEWKTKCVQMRRQMRLNEKLKKFEWEARHVGMRSRPCSLNVWNKLEPDSKHLVIESKTRSTFSTYNVNSRLIASSLVWTNSLTLIAIYEQLIVNSFDLRCSDNWGCTV